MVPQKRERTSKTTAWDKHPRWWSAKMTELSVQTYADLLFQVFKLFRGGHIVGLFSADL